jgi:uncharacterized protein with von Willebrand factor type A (vWA) domain
MSSEAPPPRLPEATVTLHLVELCGRLRAAGVRGGVDGLIAAHRALAEVEPTRTETEAALRCVLCRSPRDRPLFDAAFEAVFGPPPPDPGETPLKPEDLESPEAEARDEEPEDSATLSRGAADVEAGGADDAEVEQPSELSPQRWSGLEVLREKDFRAYTPADRVIAREALRRLAAALPRRRSSRLRPVRGRGERLDVSATLRASLRSGGEPGEVRFASRITVPRRLVLVCDLSGSMGPYATMLLEYAHAAICAGQRVEAFCFATRLARVTMDLRARDADRALAAAEARIPDRSGGTRIGAAIGQLNREHGRRIGRGAVVVVVSDGWDRGEPGLLATEMARLRRSAHRVLWLDPNVGSPGFEPLTRGMREAMPHVERVLPARNLRSVEELAAVLANELV